MLGRYVSGTLLILGVAMLLAPEAPEQGGAEPGTEVARSGASPLTLAQRADPLPRPVQTSAASDGGPDARAGEGSGGAPALAEPGEPRLAAPEGAIETAVLEALGQGGATLPDARDRAPGSAAAGLQGGAGAADEAGDGAADGAGRLFVTGSRVNVRAGPSTRFQVITSVAYGDAVELVTWEGDNWARIRLPDEGRTGYMARSFLAERLSGG